MCRGAQSCAFEVSSKISETFLFQFSCPHRVTMAKIYNALKIDYLRQEQLAGFHKYKYKSVDTSPLSKYVMHPFWNWTVKFYPMWLAPNLMTFIGWLLSVANFSILAYYDWNINVLSNPEDDHLKIPRWVWLFCAFSHFSSHTLDGTDGKQARRTKSSSPLGELFDHGMDSSEGLLMTIAVTSILGIGPHFASEWELFVTLVCVLVGFFLSHWEKYNTSVLYLPWVYDVSQLLMFVAFFTTYLCGPAIWRYNFIGQRNVANTTTLILSGSGVGIGVPVTLYNIYCMRRTHPECCPSLLEGMMPLIPLSTSISLFTLWAYYSPSRILQMEPRVFYISLGMVFANITCRLIVSQMSGTRCERFNFLIYPLLVIVPGSLLKIIPEKNALYIYTIYVVLAHIHYGICVVNQLCDHLEIKCFKVSSPKLSNNTTNSHKHK